jgi:hypothetical protein
MTHHSKVGLALFLALIVGLAGSAKATSLSLGHISGPGVFSTGNNKDIGPFTDRIYFLIEPGISLIFSATVLHHTWRHGGIYDMDGTLNDASGVILNGDATTIFTSPYPDRLVTFPEIVLGPGRYFVSIFGHSSMEVHSFNDYSIKATFAATPLPASLVFMLTALGAFGGLGLRRMQRSGAKRSEPLS